MRKKAREVSAEFRILIVDDDVGIIDSLSVLLNRAGYFFKGTTDPLEAIEMVRNEKFDLLILDFLMTPIHGDQVVERIRMFNKELYILLLTGHKDLSPPLHTIRELDIQGYCEKSNRFDQLLLLIESGIKSISQMRIISKFRDGLNSILTAVPRIYQLQPIDSILEEILIQIMPIIQGTDAFILVDDVSNQESRNRSFFKGIGRFHGSIGHFWESLSPRLMEDLGRTRATCEKVFSDIGVLVPLLDESKHSIGVIYVEGCDRDDGLKLLEIFSSQAASSLQNAFLHSLVNIKNEELDRTYVLLKRRYLDTIEALRKVVDAKDEYTRGHSDRVAYYAYELGRAVGLDEDDIETLKLGGLFHDVGKIGTADDILLKDTQLSQDEFDEIKRHTVTGANILSVITMFKNVVPLVRHHHEHFDGRGYPDGLAGEDIPYLARILSVADAYDAMMSNRVYRNKLGAGQIVEELLRGRGSQFDTRLVDTFVELIDSFIPPDQIGLKDFFSEY